VNSTQKTSHAALPDTHAITQYTLMLYTFINLQQVLTEFPRDNHTFITTGL